MSVKLDHSEIIEETFGSWPTFHDAEILSICLDRSGVAISIRMLAAQLDRSESIGERGTQNSCYEVLLRFHDIENLVIQDFGYQNVISALVLSEILEKRFTSGNVENRIKVELDSVFGATCGFTCRAGAVVSLEETKLLLGDPFAKSPEP